MGAEARANIAVTIGDVNVAPGATAVIGMNRVGSDANTQKKTVREYKDDLFVSEPRSVRAELINTKGSLTEGTCQWIRHNEIYRSWLDAQESGLLWISGRPGRGKTMLSIFLTQEWESLPDCAVLYVFCGDKSTSDEIAIMRSLLYQVLDQVPSMVKHVEDCLGTGERTKRTLSSRGDLWAMFASILTDPKLGPVLGLIDGLDECHRDSTRWLLNNLRQVFDKESRSRSPPYNPFRLAIVSRDMVGLRSFPRLNLETKTDAIAKDVSRVISAKIKEHDLFSELGLDFIKEVKTTLWHRSDGTFLWVGFAIQELLSVETKTEMRIALDAIPQDLGALYSKILLRIKGPMRGKIAQLLRWVTLACHSLTVDQLAEALDVDAQTIVDLVAMSGSLLTLSRRMARDMPTSRNAKPTFSMQWRNKGAIVKLVHASVGEFLKGEANNDILRTPEFRIEVEEMELHITQSQHLVLVCHLFLARARKTLWRASRKAA
ncbi:NACHT domain-containing protein [Fusarium keratoplasticum]|nr:NACHT domain-containing protein [Fusarium keratoplasticum]